MPILKNKTQGNFTYVSQNITRDKNLSITERGLLLTLLSLPDNWDLSIRGLSKILPDGHDKISKSLNSLISKGYVTRWQDRNDKGIFGQITLEVHESPVTSNKKEENCIPNKSEPDMANPDTANPDTANPDTANPPQDNNNNRSKQTVNNQRECLRDTLPDSDYQKLVSEFGKSNVDYQIKRISEHHYKGCMNYATIKDWCEERLPQMSKPQCPAKTKGSFFNFQQHVDYNFGELEDMLTGTPPFAC